MINLNDKKRKNINRRNPNKKSKLSRLNRRVLLPLIVIIAIVGAVFVTHKAFEKWAFRDYTMKLYMGDDRYVTGVKINENAWKGSKTAVLINTDFIHDAVSAIPYAKDINAPVYFTLKHNIEDTVIKDMKKRHIENVEIMGGITSISARVERALKRAGFNVTRIVEERGVGLSLKLAKLMNDRKRVDAIAFVIHQKENVANGVSFLQVASRDRIPVVVLKERDRDRFIRFVRDNNIKKVYVVGTPTSMTSSTVRMLPNVVNISGKDRFDVNLKIIKRFYKKGHTPTIYLTRGGAIENNDKEVNIGDFINALSAVNKAASEGAPLMFVKEVYLTKDEESVIKELGVKTINQIGFKLQSKSLFNPERVRVISALVLMGIGFLLVFRVYRKEH